MTYDDILQMKPRELINWLEQEFIIQLPANLDTIENLQLAQEMFSKFGNQYAYLTMLFNYAKISLREMKRNKDLPKNEIDDMIDKKDAIEKTMSAVDKLKGDLSRMLTVKQEINKELGLDGFNNRFVKNKKD